MHWTPNYIWPVKSSRLNNLRLWTKIRTDARIIKCDKKIAKLFHVNKYALRTFSFAAMYSFIQIEGSRIYAFAEFKPMKQFSLVLVFLFSSPDCFPGSFPHFLFWILNWIAHSAGAYFRSRITGNLVSRWPTFCHKSNLSNADDTVLLFLSDILVCHIFMGFSSCAQT